MSLGVARVVDTTHLKEFVNQDASLVDHREVERTPILEKGEVEEVVVDDEVVVLGVIVGCRRLGGMGTANLGMVIWRVRLAVEDFWSRRRVREGREVQPGRWLGLTGAPWG